MRHLSPTLLTTLLVAFCVGSPLVCNAKEAATDGVASQRPVAGLGVTHVLSGPDELVLTVRSSHRELQVVELQPHQSLKDVAETTSLADVGAGAQKLISIPRWDGRRDRLYSAFVARSKANNHNAEVIGRPRYVEDGDISASKEPFPKASSKKGLQVQMVDDAIDLGIKHATLNVDLTALVDLHARDDSIRWEMDGQTYYFNRRAVERMPVKVLSDAGVQVTLILLNYVSQDPEKNELFKHPRASAEPPNRLTAFNTVTPDGIRYFKATIEFLADRFSGEEQKLGSVVGYIVGNEVNSHWHWYNSGKVEPDQVIEEYHKTIRLVHTAIRKSSAAARVYISLDHFWNVAMDKNRGRVFGGKELVDGLNRLSKLRGDFDWHIAHHPYPENLFEPRTWLDTTALPKTDSPRITFKNLEQLTGYLNRDELKYRGTPRRVILSEQGFHTPDGPEGELWQAAAFCYAYYKVARLGGVDAFILHRHVDHAHEGGLNLGLWTRRPNSTSSPHRKKRIYEAFRHADSPDWQEAFQFALPVIGIPDWSEILHDPSAM